jgi:hypothetical protein
MGQHKINKINKKREFNEKCKIYLLLSTNLRFYDSKTIPTPKMALPHHAGKLFASK